MYHEKTVAVVIPAYNEEKLIGRTIDSVPDFADKIIVVDDCSSDGTSECVSARARKQPDRILLLKHSKNQGVGGATISGYKWCRDNKIDITVVMDGDAQMDPKDLPALLDPIADGEVDYTKGNRLFTGEAWGEIPHICYLGNAALSLMTKIASGYWHVADSQSGYRAASLKVLQTIDLDLVHKRYGTMNDVLVRLNIYNFRVRDIPITPVYGIGEKSGFNAILIIPSMTLLIFRLFIKRMVQKYIIRDFHPLVLFYISGFIFTSIGILMGLFVVYRRIFIGVIMDNTPLFTVLLLLLGWQFILFAMWFDMESNRHLK